MYFSRFFLLLCFIVKTVEAAANCSWSQRTMHVVSSCPMTSDEKLMAEKIKKCEGLAGLQDCSGPSLFKYHCVLNEAGDEFIEVCAPEVRIFLGKCATFNISNGRIEPHFNRTCDTGENPCPLQYMSSESYQFPTCYGFLENFTTYEKVTEGSNTSACLEEKKRQMIVIAITAVVTCIYIFTLPFIFCRDRCLLCIRKCTERLNCSGYGFCNIKEKEANKKEDMALPERKGYTKRTSTSDEGEDFTMETVTSDEMKKEYTPREKKKKIQERNLHPFPKQIFSLCITNICSINHISHISNRKIWLSNRKHIMQINPNGSILQNFHIDDAAGSASHTIDRDGNLLFFKDDTVFRGNSNGTNTTFLKQTGKILCICYSRINDEILLGTCDLSGIGIHSKILKYNKKGTLVQTIALYKGQKLYVLPMFICENINGDICTTDSGTLMVKGVDKFGNPRFYYNGQPTQTDFCPTGICNDAYGHIIVCNRHDTNPSVHVLDMRGLFLAVILTDKNGISDPYGLCIDEHGYLYLGQYDSNTLMVYRYLDEK